MRARRPAFIPSAKPQKHTWGCLGVDKCPGPEYVDVTGFGGDPVRMQGTPGRLPRLGHVVPGVASEP